MDAYHWKVLYRDGSIHEQIVGGVDNGSWAEVDKANVERIVIFPHDERLPIHGVTIPPGKTPFFTFRRGLYFDFATGVQGTHPTVIVMGWEGCYLYVDEFGNAILCDDQNAGFMGGL